MDASWARLESAAADPHVLVLPLDLAVGPETVTIVRRGLRDWLQRTGLPEAACSDLLIAAGEAATNALEHAGAPHQPDSPGAWLWARQEPTLIRVVVVDRGVWRTPGAGGYRGRGRMLMSALVDELTIDTGAAGTRVELVKYCAASDQ